MTLFLSQGKNISWKLRGKKIKAWNPRDFLLLPRHKVWMLWNPELSCPKRSVITGLFYRILLTDYYRWLISTVRLLHYWIIQIIYYQIVIISHRSSVLYAIDSAHIPFRLEDSSKIRRGCCSRDACDYYTPVWEAVTASFSLGSRVKVSLDIDCVPARSSSDYSSIRSAWILRVTKWIFFDSGWYHFY